MKSIKTSACSALRRIQEGWSRLPIRTQWAIFLLFYTAFFAVTAILCLSNFSANEKNMIFKTDGMQQHLPFMQYCAAYMKGVLENFFNTGQLVFPNWSFGLYLGSDIFTSLAHHSFFDPITYLSLFLQDKPYPLVYAALTLLRMYLSGLFFIFFASHFKYLKRNILIGTVAYVFSGFMLTGVIRHPMFSVGMMYLPLILLGYEHLLKGKKPILLILSIVLAVLSNFYFAYMCLIFLVLYALVRFFTLYKKGERAKIFPRLFGKSVGSVILALLLCAWLWLPLASLVLSGSRGVETGWRELLHYPWNYYPKLFPDFISPQTPSFWTQMSFPALALPAVLLLFLRKDRKKLAFRILFLIAVLFLFLPFAGLILSAFSYASNRWCFAFTLLVCLLLIAMLPKLSKLRRSDWISFFAAFVLLGAFSWIGPVASPGRRIGFFLYGGTLVVLALIHWKRVWRPLEAKNLLKPVTSLVLLTVVIVNCSLLFYFRLDPNHENQLDDYFPETRSGDLLDTKKAPKQAHEILPIFNQFGEEELSSLESLSLGQLANIPKEDASFYRVELEDLTDVNAALNFGYKGTTMFLSLYPKNVFQYHQDMGLPNRHINIARGLDARSAPYGLWSVKYFVGRNREKATVPYGFSEIEKNKRYVLYQNDFPLPFGYTYKNFVPREEYDALSTLMRQETLMTAAMAESDLPLKRITAREAVGQAVTEQPFTLSSMKNVTVENGRVSVGEKGGSMVLSVNIPANSESYLMWHDTTLIHNPIRIEVPGRSLSISFSQDSNFCNNVEDALYCLGYHDTPFSEIKLSFSSGFSFPLEQLKLFSVDMSGRQAQIDDLRTDSLQNVTFETDRITGKISLSEPKLLCLSMPYSTGWTTTVNGERQKLLQVNRAQAALMLPAGEHEIELTYKTPLLTLGLTLSGLTFFGLVLVLCLSRRKRKMKGRGRTENILGIHNRRKMKEKT